MRYTEPMHIQLSPEQRAKVERLAARSHRSVGAVIRAAIDAYTAPRPRRERIAALEDLFSLEAPVDSWAVMEEEILRGGGTATGDLGAD